MDFDLYELERKKSRYTSLKENLRKTVNTLSSTNLSDNFATAAREAKNSYSVNYESSIMNEISACNDLTKTLLEKARTMYSNASYSLDKVNTEIDDAGGN